MLTAAEVDGVPLDVDALSASVGKAPRSPD
jgi:hypothetical protein